MRFINLRLSSNFLSRFALKANLWRVSADGRVSIWHRFTKNLSISLVGSVASIVIGLGRTAVLTKSLAIADYGKILIVINLFSFLGTFFPRIPISLKSGRNSGSFGAKRLVRFPLFWDYCFNSSENLENRFFRCCRKNSCNGNSVDGGAGSKLRNLTRIVKKENKYNSGLFLFNPSPCAPKAR